MQQLGNQITRLEASLRELIRLWERYFSGDIKLPPDKEREAMARTLRQLTERPGVMRSSDSFRLEQLQHRFMTYSQNWERMLREREEGRGRSVAAIRAARRLQEAPAPPPANASRRATVDSSGSDTLFDRYRTAKEGLGQASGLDREAFEKQITSQRAALEQKLGRKVDFDIKVSEGKVKLVVRKGESLEK